MTDLTALEFDKITDMLAENAISASAKKRAPELAPYLDIRKSTHAMAETTDAVLLIEALGMPPLAIMDSLSASVLRASQGLMLSPAELVEAALFATTSRRMQQYLKKGEKLHAELSLTGRALQDLTDLSREIDFAIRGDEVTDSASTALRSIRRKLETQRASVKQKLSALLQSHPQWFSDSYTVMRNGRFTLPVRAQFRAQVPGQVIDRSQTGGTVFIEPASAAAIGAVIAQTEIEEDSEVRRILYSLSGIVADMRDAIEENMRLMEQLDFVFAKGKLSMQMQARPCELNMDRKLRIVGGIHPLLDRAKAVPLDFTLGGDQRGVAITGPNTGGKTVALKTIGLMSVMAQSGLHVLCREGTTLCMFNAVLTDIGDGQSISENLSTFSAHMTGVLHTLNSATRESLVLLDELGSGTDPAEGMGIAVAVLEELLKRECLFVITTHYPEIKEFARSAPNMQNARMAFDPATLSPLYRMEIGEAGESCALHIARRLGFPEALLERAARAAYKGEVDYRESRGNTPRAQGAPRLEKPIEKKGPPPRALAFKRGDCVRAYPEGILAIVVTETDDAGNILVQLRGPEMRKKLYRYKRLQLVVPGEQMYPDDYDFSIVFDSVAVRKARHDMGRKKTDDVIVVREGTGK